MKRHFALLFTLLLFICFQVTAITVPAALSAPPVLKDSLHGHLPVFPAASAKEKKAGLWSKVKNKVALYLIKRQLKTSGKQSAKATLGWVSLGIIVFSIGLLIISSSASVAGILFLVGFLAGLVSLIIPRSKAEKAQKRKGNTGALIALGIGIAFVVGLAIAFGNAWR